MSTAIATFLRRAGTVVAASLVAMSALRFVGLGFSLPASLFVLLGGLGGSLWACYSLAPRTGRIPAGVLALLMALTSGFCSLFVASQVANGVFEYRYRAAGYEMKSGCNLGAAMHAETSLFTLSNRIDELRQDSPIDTNEVKRLEAECATTKKRLEFLEADIRRRGHRGTVPVPKNANQSLQPTAAALGDSHHD
jgi:hypothetical protein